MKKRKKLHRKITQILTGKNTTSIQKSESIIEALHKTDWLEHTTTKTPSRATVCVLDTGAVINAEASAMLQALHSRSTGGIKNHLKILAEKGAGDFIKSFYVGYGHKSIGDCGTTTIFIESVSMLAAKAIQDWPLYSGQESSTRYVDFQYQPFLNPLKSQKGSDILEKWRTFYITSMADVRAHLTKQFPCTDPKKTHLYTKAINARAFDILRGFLPAGATTNLAWHTNLRQAADKLMMLRHHPLTEVREIADAIDHALRKQYPNSFDHERFDHTEKYNEQIMQRSYYFHNAKHPDFAVTKDRIDKKSLPYDILHDRPMKTELPRYCREYGDIMFDFTLDFGSFRDIQRHRAITQRMPLLTTEIGFEQWYLNELPPHIAKKAQALLARQEKAIASLPATPETRQYYIAMGYKTSNRIIGDLGGLIYLIELRSTRFVHPTLRKRAIQMAHYLLKTYKKCGLILHLDTEPHEFDVERGAHDIEMK
jgi:thymidylate synthase ThyX